MRRASAICALAFAALAVFATGANAQEKLPLRLVQTIPMPDVKGRIDHMDVDVKGERLFVSGLGNNSLEVLNLRAGKWIRTIPGFQVPQGVLYLPALNKLFVASNDDGMLRVFRATTLELIDAVHLEPGPNRVIYDPPSGHIYVGYGGKDAGKNYGDVGIIDAKTDKHIGDIRVALTRRKSLGPGRAERFTSPFIPPTKFRSSTSPGVRWSPPGPSRARGPATWRSTKPPIVSSSAPTILRN